jgi:diguanylate cyclase (GGDEF)-like protein
MHLLAWVDWVDSRTLVTCRCLIAIVFTVVLYTIHRLHPYLRGAGFIALGFLCTIPSTMLAAAHGAIPAFASVVLSGLFGFLSYLFLYRGVLLFCHARGLQHALYAASATALCCLIYFSQFNDRIVPRIFATSIVFALARALTAWTLFRNASGRLTILLFAISLTLSATISLTRALLTLHHGAPQNILASDPIQTTHQVLALLVLLTDGLFYLAIFFSAANERMHDQVLLDDLTGSLNRRGVEDHLTVEVARTRRTHRPIAILLIDIDKFKTINHVHGRRAGDEVLRTVARAIASVLRPCDKLGRFGGDEFLLLLPETSTPSAMDIALRIRQAVQSIIPADRPPVLTLSIGITHCDTFEEPIHILARADQALYQAKSEGRDRARSHPPTPSTTPRIHIPRSSLLSRVTARRRPSGRTY